MSIGSQLASLPSLMETPSFGRTTGFHAGRMLQDLVSTENTFGRITAPSPTCKYLLISQEHISATAVSLLPLWTVGKCRTHTQSQVITSVSEGEQSGQTSCGQSFQVELTDGTIWQSSQGFLIPESSVSKLGKTVLVTSLSTGSHAYP